MRARDAIAAIARTSLASLVAAQPRARVAGVMKTVRDHIAAIFARRAVAASRRRRIGTNRSVGGRRTVSFQQPSGDYNFEEREG
jgi:hypothetical protein